MGDTLDTLESKGIRVYQRSPTLAFALTPSRALFITPLAVSELLYNRRNAKPRYEKLRESIEAGEYVSLCDFLTDMKLQTSAGVSYRQLYRFEIERITND